VVKIFIFFQLNIDVYYFYKRGGGTGILHSYYISIFTYKIKNDLPSFKSFEKFNIFRLSFY